VQLKGPGEDPRTFSMSSDNDGPPDGLPRHLSGWSDRGGLGAFNVSNAVKPATFDQEQLGAAMLRSYTPAMKAAGVHGRVEVRYTVGADGRARILAVNSETPALIQVGRSVIESLTFTAGPVATEARLMLMFEPARVPVGGPLPRPRGPKR
jgi:hypothetical protein